MRLFVTYQEIPTVGAEQIRYFVVPATSGVSVATARGGTAAGSNHAPRAARHMLAVAHCVDDASGWNTVTSQILEMVLQVSQ